ncbi:MAG: glycosyltransferase family 2 protein [bacterium]|nr:glycosyltransferase family 2 protein [bacterium]
MVPKKSTVYLIIIVLWLATCLYFDFTLAQPIVLQTNIFAQISIIAFLICLNLFWLYGYYHLVFTVFSWYLSLKPANRQPGQPANYLTDQQPRVAILYTTMNDFQSRSVQSCLTQRYQNYDVYILDDSSDINYRQEIDTFAKEYPGVNVIRRHDRNGFKAGNLNHCLKQIHSNYEYFAICDADTVLPPDFLAKTVSCFSQDDNIGFVQARQTANPGQKGRFARVFGFNTDLHWLYYAPVKEKYGFMMFYGHGAVIRTSAWKDIGGFPEIVTEDLAFSSKLREKGYYGVLAANVECYEDFPETYRALRRRTGKWLTGTMEYLLSYYPALLRSPVVSWVEKADIVIGAGSLLLALPFLLYVFVAGLALPLSQNIFQLNIPLFLILPDHWSNIGDILTKTEYKVYWGFDFYLIMLVTSCSQLLPVMHTYWKKPFQMFKFSAMFTYLCLATAITSSYDLMEYLFTRKTEFAVTGATSRLTLGSKEKVLIVLELTAGTILMLTACLTANVWLLTVGLGLILSPLVFKYDFENKVVNLLLNIPFAINVILLVLIGRSAGR